MVRSRSIVHDIEIVMVDISQDICNDIYLVVVRFVDVAPSTVSYCFTNEKPFKWDSIYLLQKLMLT